MKTLTLGGRGNQTQDPVPDVHNHQRVHFSARISLFTSDRGSSNPPACTGHNYVVVVELSRAKETERCMVLSATTAQLRPSKTLVIDARRRFTAILTTCLNFASTAEKHGAASVMNGLCAAVGLKPTSVKSGMSARRPKTCCAAISAEPATHRRNFRPTFRAKAPADLRDPPSSPCARRMLISLPCGAHSYACASTTRSPRFGAAIVLLHAAPPPVCRKFSALSPRDAPLNRVAVGRQSRPIHATFAPPLIRPWPYEKAYRFSPARPGFNNETWLRPAGLSPC